MFIVNLLLFIVIVVFGYFKIYKKSINFNCDYGTTPVEILDIAGDYFPKSEIGNKSVFGKTICVFNKLPGVSELENINKLFNLYKDKISMQAIFTKKFKLTFALDFPHRFLTRYKFSCKNQRPGSEGNFYLVLFDDKIVHTGQKIDFIEMNFVVHNNLSGQSPVEQQISTGKLKHRIIERIKERELELLDINTDQAQKFENFLDYSEIYFFHVNCSACKLKEIFRGLNLKRIVSEEKIIIVFSIFANRFELKSLIEEEGIQLPIYIDYRDEFRLHTKITNERENPVIIKLDNDFGAGPNVHHEGLP